MCTVASIPGLLLLQRFAPLGGREPQLEALERIEHRPVSRARFAAASLAAAAGGFAAALAISALLSALKAARLHPGPGSSSARRSRVRSLPPRHRTGSASPGSASWVS